MEHERQTIIIGDHHEFGTPEREKKSRAATEALIPTISRLVARYGREPTCDAVVSLFITVAVATYGEEATKDILTRMATQISGAVADARLAAADPAGSA